jgi:hypothetical protein
MPERLFWLVDEYVLKSEMPDGILRAIKRVTCLSNADKAHQFAPRSIEPVQHKSAA